MKKERSLSFQIWMWFAIGIIIMGIVISYFVFTSYEQVLTEQIYRELGLQQQQQIQEWIALDEFSVEAIEMEEIQPAEVKPVIEGLTVEHIIKNYESQDIESGIEIQESDLFSEIIPAISLEGIEAEPIAYEAANTFFVVTEETVGKEDLIIYTYASDNIRKRIIRNFSFVFIAIAVLILFMLFPAKLIANRITRPLVGLEKSMDHISRREWTEPIHSTGAKEIVSLADSSERMRQQLIAYDQKQQALLQNISHELKTPIMVIRSYIQAKEDGLYQDESEQKTFQTIDQEAVRMQRIVEEMIQLANIEYAADHVAAIKKSEIHVKDLIEKTCERMKFQRPELDMELDLIDEIIVGDTEHWKVIYENLIQNAIRHAETRVMIRLSHKPEGTRCEIYNDGNQISDQEKDTIFETFSKGKTGETGLGLAIVRRILSLYQGKIWFENQEIGVSFYIQI